MSKPQHFDVVVLGGGSGLTAAYYAAKEGKSVAVVEERSDALGGTCVNRGCVPTKQLIQSAEVLATIREASDFGIDLDQSSVRIDFDGILSRMRERRAKAAASTRSWVEEDFTPFFERARFDAEKRLALESGQEISGSKIFLASGARPLVPPISGLDDVGYLTNESVLELHRQPESLIVIGGGYVGCELAHFFSTLGTSVTLVDEGRCLLGEDDDVRQLFTREIAKRMELRLEARAKEVSRVRGRKRLLLERADGDEESLEAETLLVATGRRPNTDELGLGSTGVETDEDGWIVVDEQLRTTHPDIYAYGDVIGQGMFKHTSSYEGELAYRNSQGAGLEVSYLANPHAVFSRPQIGSVGLTERECLERRLDYRCVRKDYADVAKGEILGSPAGFAKLLVERGSDRILGFHVIGPQAADLVHEVVVAMNAGDGTAGLVRLAIHVHPTISELVRAVFDDAAP